MMMMKLISILLPFRLRAVAGDAAERQVEHVLAAHREPLHRRVPAARLLRQRRASMKVPREGEGGLDVGAVQHVRQRPMMDGSHAQLLQLLWVYRGTHVRRHHAHSRFKSPGPEVHPPALLLCGPERTQRHLELNSASGPSSQAPKNMMQSVEKPWIFTVKNLNSEVAPPRSHRLVLFVLELPVWQALCDLCSNSTFSKETACKML